MAKKMEVKKTQPESTSGALDINQVSKIVSLMADNDLTYFNFETADAKIELRRGSDLEAAKSILQALPAQASHGPITYASAPAPAAPVVSSPAAAATESPKAESTEPVGPVIASPMVGTFYRSAAPGEKAFVSIGDSVDENTTVCIIEAMKVMNEIKAEARGVISRILADEGKPVQYGQALFELKA